MGKNLEGENCELSRSGNRLLLEIGIKKEREKGGNEKVCSIENLQPSTLTECLVRKRRGKKFHRRKCGTRILDWSMTTPRRKGK